MLMCLLHDVVEIDAGDTYAYDTDGLKTQQAREEAAKERIYSLLPDDQKARADRQFSTNSRPTETAGGARLPTRWTISSRSCSTTATAAGTGSEPRRDCAKQVYGRQSRTEKGSAYLYKLTDSILQANIKKGALKEK